jgi:dihydroorotate dehydrogenase (NAD+) catalytic subunit
MGILFSSGKRDFFLEPEWTNVTGMLGFSDESLPTIDCSRLGALVTNPISLFPRMPARLPRVLSFQGGFLLHTGHPNPGLSAILGKHQRRWKDLPCPVIVHLLGQTVHDIREMVERLEEVEAVAAIELGLEATDPDSVSQLTAAALQGELPVIIQVPVDCSEELLLAIVGAGAKAIGLGPPRGVLPGPNGELVSGRLFGPAIFPIALQAAYKWNQMLDIPVIASGGIYSTHQLSSILAAGASAVQLDTILWTDPEGILNTRFPSNPSEPITLHPGQ